MPSSVNQVFQIGAESTSGTLVGGSKRVDCFDWTPGIEVDSKFFRGSGRKYPSTQELNKEWMAGGYDGEADFNGWIYPLCGVLGSASPVAHGSSSTAKDWIWTPPLSGNASPKTYSMESGDSTRAKRWTYGLFTSWKYKLSRDDATTNGDFIGRRVEDGVSLTSSPTAVALAPIGGAMWDVYLDSTSGGLGTTKLLRVKEVEFEFNNVYNVNWFINSAQTSWTDHSDLAPETMVSLLIDADSTGMDPLTHLRSGATRYLRIKATGNQIASDGPGSVTNEFIHDMAVKWEKPDKWADSDGVYAIKWTGKIVEDLAWGSGTAHKATLTNLLTAL
jgi:hypothetical protein